MCPVAFSQRMCSILFSCLPQERTTTVLSPSDSSYLHNPTQRTGNARAAWYGKIKACFHSRASPRYSLPRLRSGCARSHCSGKLLVHEISSYTNLPHFLLKICCISRCPIATLMKLMQNTAPKNYSRKRQTVKVTLWVKPSVKAEVQRRAESEKLSISKVGGTLLEEAIRQSIHSQYNALLQPMLRQIIREELRAFGNRIVFFLMRIAFAAEQSRILITNILDRILRREGAPEYTLTRLVDQSSALAKRNIIQKTPQLQSLLTEWEGSFTDGREEGNGTSNG
jgi:hypothetical protein